MALVICWVFLTERIRRRMSTRAGMALRSGLAGRSGRGLEDPGELLERGGELLRRLALQVLLLRDQLEQLGMARVEEGVELALVAAGVAHREAVEEPVGRRIDDDDLLL